MKPENAFRFLETTQHDLVEMVSGSEMLFTAMRSCVLHNIGFFHELTGGTVDHIAHLEFLEAHGPRLVDNVEQGSDFYDVGRGWKSTSVADLLRFNGSNVFVQNLAYNLESTDMRLLSELRRVTTDAEMERALVLAEFGGGDKSTYLNALQKSLDLGSIPLVTILIPSSVDLKKVGGHTVTVLEVSEGQVTYYDSDGYAYSRYENRSLEPLGTQISETERLFKAPADRFASVMSGEVMHIWAPKIDSTVY